MRGKAVKTNYTLAELKEFHGDEEEKDDDSRFDPVSYTHLTLPTKA